MERIYAIYRFFKGLGAILTPIFFGIQASDILEGTKETVKYIPIETDAFRTQVESENLFKNIIIGSILIFFFILFLLKAFLVFKAQANRAQRRENIEMTL